MGFEGIEIGLLRDQLIKLIELVERSAFGTVPLKDLQKLKEQVTNDQAGGWSKRIDWSNS